MAEVEEPDLSDLHAAIVAAKLGHFASVAVRPQRIRAVPTSSVLAPRRRVLPAWLRHR